MAELLLGALLPVLFEHLTSHELIKFSNREKVRDLVKKWETKLRYISALLEDAEEKAMNGDVKVQPWLEDLRDLIYDIDDMLDEFVTKERIRSLAKKVADGASTSKVRSLVSGTFTSLCLGKIVSDHKLRSRMKAIDGRLNFILEQKRDLGLNESSGSTVNKRFDFDRMSDSLPKSYVIGREEDERAILAKLLTETDDQHLSVIPIVGLGGVGKTTLAQSVFNNPTVVQAFPKRGWACVSDKFNIVEIARALLGSLGGSFDTKDDLNVLHNKLREILFKEKFLIVLDDYWSVDYNNWERLYNLYSLGVKGSKVIVTTRDEGVASMMTNNRPTFSLRELSRDDCLSLLAYHALDIDNFDAHPHLKLIGKEIAAKCKGLPLAAKSLGGLLRSKTDSTEWEDIRDSKIWNLPRGKDDILLALKLSYIHLPPHLKRCFVFCAIFPQDYEFDRDELVLLWMAEGLVNTKCGDSRRGMVYQGKKQFDELLNRSFFQRSTQNESLFVIHDLMHDLATSIGGKTCWTVEASEIEDVQYYKSLENIRHLLYSSIPQKMDAMIEKCHLFKGLRTFITSHQRFLGGHLSESTLEECLQNLKYLRALSLKRYMGIYKIPNCIGHLMHLRYLNFSECHSLKELPESICTMYNLETLILYWCESLVELPSGMDKLINLKCLDIRRTPQLKKMPVELGRMLKFEILTKFVVGREEDGLRLKVLKHWQYLQGELSTFDLHNVGDVGDARDAGLSRKVGLTTLSLIWDSKISCSRNADKEKRVLEHLQPHREIKEVGVYGYGGVSFSLWIGDPSMIHMTKVRLMLCKKVTILPSFGILPSLRELYIYGMDAVRSVGSEFYGNVETTFPSLEVLEFKNMPTWEVWSSSSSGGEKEIEEPFPRLIKLTLLNCPVLVSNLPHRLCSIVELKIFECPHLKASPCMADLSSLKDLYLQSCEHDLLAMMISSMRQNAPIKRISLKGIQKLTYLNQDTLSGAEHLEIRNCSELIGLWEDNIPEVAVMECSLSCLKYLCIEECANLQKLPNNMQRLTSLKELRIKHCSKLESLPEDIMNCNLEELVICGLSLEEIPKLPSTLIGLNVDECAKLHCFLSTYIHLTDLSIANCPCLDVLPKLPSCLQSLILRNCKKIKALPNQMNTTLTSLHCLVVHGLSIESFPEGGLPLSIEEFTVGECPELKQPLKEWGLHKLTALKTLSIQGEIGSLCEHQQEGIIIRTSSFPPLPSDWMFFPSNLVVLNILDQRDMVRLSNGLRDHLTSLRRLELYNCPNLQYLPDEGFPPSLERLRIVKCSQDIENKCSKNGDFFPLIASIPGVSLTL